MAQSFNKTIEKLSNRPFNLSKAEGVFKIKPVLSSYCIEKDGCFHGTIIPWLSDPFKLHITFKHCGNLIDTTILLSEMTFKTTFNYKTNEFSRTNQRAKRQGLSL